MPEKEIPQGHRALPDRRSIESDPFSRIHPDQLGLPSGHISLNPDVDENRVNQLGMSEVEIDLHSSYPDEVDGWGFRGGAGI